MYKVMDWVATKDMVSLAGSGNTVVAGKQAMVETAVLAATVMNALGDAMPADLRVQVVEMRSDLELCKKVLKQHMEGSMLTNDDVSSHCLNHCLNPTENYTCDHEHHECDMCVKPLELWHWLIL